MQLKFVGQVKEIYKFRYTLFDMAHKQFKAKYAASFLGILWAVINPLLIMFAITFVFTVVFRAQVNNFALFVLSGIFPWFFFSNSVMEASGSIVSQRSILRQFNIPREIIPLSSVLSSLFNFFLCWVILYPVFLFVNQRIIYLLPLLFAVILLNLLFVSGLGLIFAVINVFLRDLSHFLEVLLMFWFWVTPIFYSSSMVPNSFQWIFKLNPMFFYVNCYREIVFECSMPQLSSIVAIIFWALLSLFLGLFIFSVSDPKILKRI